MRARGAAWVEPLLAASLYASLLSLRLRWWSVYEIGPDEGLNLMKGALVASGFRLYHEVWSDQPPVLTWALAALQRIAPWNVAAARSLVLAFAVLLVVCLFRIVRRAEGRAAAWIAVAALAGSTAFVRTSAAVLVGMPALALAVAALDRALGGDARTSQSRAAVAGALFGLALQTKGIVAPLLPALVLAVALRDPGGERRPAETGGGPDAHAGAGTAAEGGSAARDLGGPDAHAGAKTAAEERRAARDLRGAARQVVVLLAAAAAVFAAVAVAQDEPLAQLVAPHASDAVRRAHASGGGLDAVLASIAPETLLPVAALGLVAVALSPRPVRLVAVVWALGAGLALALHRPLWWHHVLVLELPLAWLAGAAAGLVPEGRARPLAIAAIAATIAIPAALAFERTARSIDERRTPIAWSPLGTEPVESDRWVVADRPIDAYRAGRLVPPEIAVFSAKRIQAGLLDAERLVATLESRRPERVVLRRFAVDDAVAAHLAAHYRVESAPLPVSGIAVFVEKSAPPPARFDEASFDLARALACAQRRAGGWSKTPVPHGDCDAPRSFVEEGAAGAEPPIDLDDAGTPFALDYLLDLEEEMRVRTKPAPAWLGPAIDGGLEAVLRAQGESGGWPPRFPRAKKGYQRWDAFNDGATTDSIGVLLRAHRRSSDPRFLEAAIRGGEFILRAQGPPAQAGWAQQYDDELRPAPARAFEPAAYASRETGEVMNVLLDLYLATGQARFVAPLESARAWLERSTIRPGVWARLYEPGTNRPLYGDRDGLPHYGVAEISAERRTGYEWEKRFPSVVRALARHDAWRAGGSEGLREHDRREPRAPAVDLVTTGELAELLGGIRASE